MEDKSGLPGISLELIAFLYSIGLFFNSVAAQNLYLQKLCSPESEPGINAVCHDPESLALAADVNTLRSMLRDCLCFVMVMVAGSWKDRTGLTRPLFVLAMLGEIASCAISLTGYYLWSSASVWLLAGLDGGLASLTGGKQLFYMASYCFVADRTSTQERTHRTMYMMVSILAGASVATASSGYILSALNYQIFLFLIMTINVLCICLSFILIKEQKKEESVRGEFKRSIIQTVFCRRPNGLLIWIMLISTVLMNSSVIGEMNVFIYFLEEGFNYSVTEAGIYTSYRLAMAVIGSMVFSPLATKVFKWNDFTIALVTICLSIFSTSCTAFAKTDMELYLYTLPDWSRAVFLPVAKSMMSKCLKPEEIGIFFSLSTIGEAAIPLAFLPLYDWIFKKTLNTLPGAFFLFSGGINVLILGLLCILIIFKGNKGNDLEKLENQSSNKIDLNKENNCDKNDAECIKSSQGDCKKPIES